MKALVVDDERLARRRLSRLLSQEPDVDVVGTCKSAALARDVMAQGSVDLLLLDVQMPRANGFSALDGAPRDAPLAVIFVTAHEHFAVQAFEVSACDYLLKPVTDVRLRAAVEKARAFLGRRPPAVAPPDLVELPDRPEGPGAAVLVRMDAKVLRIPVEALDWIEAAGNYVHLHVDGKVHLLRETLGAFESRLPVGRFARVHRTAIVNLDRIVEFHPTLGGDFSITLRSGEQVRMSRTYRGRIRDVFGRSI
jgi:two-component system LytT family response regulator